MKHKEYFSNCISARTSLHLLDEPTTYLDIHYQYQVLDTIRTLKDHYHITFIMVLHDINQAIEYSDEGF